ncbi:hypothetical protein F0562_012381 [Nyssa sinensis]|uniref:Protein kinase domain-containing protein n=1 Tax=Nyssa sinensis TaxID=561372 RepID=A0A5J4ZVH9_9ASTE|nr:hypothetical protein F0562_012381 [Nyssa sinensis]
MVNGNLDTWLHPEVVEANSLTLNLLQRLNIALDVASALHYLHNECEIPIIHCDLKPSNILLDNDMIAHVSDFGLARLLSNAISNFSQQQFSSIGIKGSVGYVAPEYGMGGEVATYGDVYSYGILLLEMLTGRRPTDEMFRDGLNLHNYVKMALPRRVVQIVDPILLTGGELENGAAAEEEEDDVDNEIMAEEDNRNIVSWGHGREKIQKCIVSILEIGLACSVESPRERMDMNDVTRELHHIRDAFLGSASTWTDHK